jgi:hypothetical protein
MPMWVGLIFLLPLLISVWLLQLTPAPTEIDRQTRSERKAMTAADRRGFVQRFWPGLSLLIFVYIALTIVRTLRDDFGVELWQELGVSGEPSVFARSEMWVAIAVTVLNGFAIWIRSNIAAFRSSMWLMIASLGLVAGTMVLQQADQLSAFGFMVLCGIGFYMPYVAFHTTVFERMVAASRMPSNLGFLMYLADAIGYLGYAGLMVWQTFGETRAEVLPFFRGLTLSLMAASIVALVAALVYFERALRVPRQTTEPRAMPVGST